MIGCLDEIAPGIFTRGRGPSSGYTVCVITALNAAVVYLRNGTQLGGGEGRATA